MVFSSISELYTPHPLSDCRLLLSVKPAASVQKFMQASGGSCFSCGVGNHLSWYVRKLCHILRSSNNVLSTEARPFVMAVAKALFRLNLKPLRTGHIEKMKFRRPVIDCIWSVEAIFWERMSLMVIIVLVFFSSGRLRVKFIVSK